MRVSVKFYATFKEITGKEIITLNLENEADVEFLLDELFKIYGEKLKNQLIDTKTGKILKYVKILKNGRDIDFFGGLKTKLDNGDVIAFFPPIADG